MIRLADPTTWDTIIGTGGWVGTAGVIAFITKQLVDSWLARRADKRADQTAEKSGELGEIAAGVGNASTVNAIMVKSVETLAAENERLQARVVHQDAVIAGKDEIIAGKDAQIAERDATVEKLKADLVEWVSRGQQYVDQITNYQKLLREQEGEVH